MTPARFDALVGAYGADPRRWPEGDRAAAEAYRAEQPERAQAVLAAGRRVDDLLALSAAPRLPAGLRDRMIADARGGAARWWIDRAAIALGAGWAAAACAGLAAGAMMTTYLTADARADAVFVQAALMSVDDLEVLG